MEMTGFLLHIAYLALILNLCTVIEATSGLNGRKVLLVSMDGFRHDYFQKANTPNFDALIASGIQVPYVNSTFVTSTFPCHTTIATGLYEESHGIMDNKFYDPLYRSTFSKSSLDPKWWNASEPIWINAVKAGLKVGTFFWAGSDVEHDGILPTAYRRYDWRVTFEDRVKTVVDWLSRDDYDFAVLYFDEPDTAGHKYGPDGPKIKSAIEQMDSILGLLMGALRRVGLKDKTDVIVASDHGMATINMNNQTIDITKYIDSTLLNRSLPSNGPALNMMPQPGKAQELVDALSQVEHMHAFLKEDIPERFHYKNNRRVMPVFVYADEGWVLITDKATVKDRKGEHGYDNELMSMKPIFVASGPSFKSGYRLPGPIKLVDIYPLLCHLLILEPAANNGSLARVMPLLIESSDDTDGAIVYHCSITLSFVCFLFSSVINILL